MTTNVQSLIRPGNCFNSQSSHEVNSRKKDISCLEMKTQIKKIIQQYMMNKFIIEVVEKFVIFQKKKYHLGDIFQKKNII